MDGKLLAGSVLVLAIVGAFTGMTARADSFYAVPQIFSTAPSPDQSIQSVDRFGPVGIGIELHQPAFVMKVKNVEPGSPAATTGKLKPGQIIETINGEKLHDIDPRIQLGNVITAAEASDGQVKFMVKDTPAAAAQEVVVNIPVLGTYSATWPMNCPKSDKIVRGLADYLAKPDSDRGFGGIGMLFLLGTGEEKDIEPVRQWVRGMADKTPSRYSWNLGYGGIPLCEYYLRTGDPEALPVIQKWVDTAVAAEYLGGWSQRGGAGNVDYGGGGGHLNAGGTAVVTFLMLSRECGAKVPDDTFNRVLPHFYRWAGRGTNPYGDNVPEGGLVDNGKNGNLAFAMAAAAALTPDGENSVYGGARDAAALTSFYTTTFMLHGHTGGGIGEIWRSASMSLLADKRPQMYRSFLDTRRWHYELSRRFNGSFGILDGARYDSEDWGAGYALTYIVPRKTLRVTGAKPTKFSKQYKLPERPWGTKADDAFASIEPATMADGTKPGFSHETVAVDSGRPLLERFSKPDVDDATIRRYTHHPDNFVRGVAANKAMGMNSFYLSPPKPAGEVRTKLAMELLYSPDARVRRAMLTAISARFTGEELTAFLGSKGCDDVIAMLRDPAESWWVKVAALGVVQRWPADAVLPHVDLILGFLKHEEWWLQNAALSALGTVAVDERCYRKVIPAIAEMVRTTQRWNATGPLRYGPLAASLKEAGPEVQKLIAKEFEKTYLGYAGAKTAPGGLDIASNYRSHVEFIAQSLAGVEGGYDLLFKLAKQQNPTVPLPFENVFLNADFDKFGPELLKTIKPIIRDNLIYVYMGKNRDKLLAVAAGTVQNQFVEYSTAMDGLVGLYKKIGATEYDWKVFGPDLKNAKWDYLMFDPPEKLAFDVTPWRYRPVTLPKGMESWYKPEFDPAKAGWKQGQAPFGQLNGKLLTDAAELKKWRWSPQLLPMRTMWDKEVLLMRGTFEFPPLKPGHLYRLQIDNGTGVGAGDGYRIYINGKQLIEVQSGIGRREGGKQRGAFITKEFLDQFGKGPVTLAAISFLRYGDRAVVTKPPVPQGTFSLWMEEMKLPPLDDEVFSKSATVIPMLDANWQSKQDPDNAELSPDDNRFVYDGKFLPNEKLSGSWKAVALVPSEADFDLAGKYDAKRARIQSVTLQNGGNTSVGTLIWSGNMLMDLTRYQALRMYAKNIGGTEYLFIEDGGFSSKNPPTWKSSLVVLKRDN